MSRCRSCLAPIEWAKTVKGYRLPLDPKGRPGPPGNVIVLENSDGTPLVRALKAGERELHDERKLRRSHFATCPDAAAHRKGH